jgi:hypothetical protein
VFSLKDELEIHGPGSGHDEFQGRRVQAKQSRSAAVDEWLRRFSADQDLRQAKRHNLRRESRYE